MAELGLEMYRFSIAWARIIPDGGGAIRKEGIKSYDKIIDYLLSRGIQPFVTLYHLDLPHVLAEEYNGWESRRCVLAFERHTRIYFRVFDDRVKY